MRRTPPYVFGIVAFVGLAALGSFAVASDWTRFRGPNGGGVSGDTIPTPVTWSPTQNVKWKIELPGPGSSCPIVVGNKVFVTSWSGYGTDRGRAGKQEDLLRHLTCYDRQTGDKIWDKTVKPYLPEDNYGGMFAEHGYCTHTPVSDGERVYVFFGKTGALAFDLNGKQLWQQKELGTDSNQMNWGSSSSPILYKNLLIVTAAMESQTIYGLDKLTGNIVWKAPAEAFGSTWGTPVLVDVDDKRTDLVIGVPDEIWGFNPETGKLRWYCEALRIRTFCSSVVTDNKGVVYAMGDQGSGSIAVKAGGKNDVTQTNVLWTGRESNRIGTPVVADGKLYFVSGKVVTCVDAETGKKVFQGRLTGGSDPMVQEDGPPRRPPGGNPGGGPGGRGFRGGRGGGGGGFGGGQDYSSPVVADGKLYFVARNGDTFVVKTGDKFEQLAVNKVASEAEDFSASPAISNGDIFLRSSKHLYCIKEGAKLASK